uniref:Zona pellucida sperm-binding protein 1-like n=1 Tax=Geotrypetes seraphini TaxID=260995 RepID=A0A6P8PLU7_GEOSA|nr:zona pellucida sperm-binding protein 1-like [Geotrypetes seraphini]
MGWFWDYGGGWLFCFFMFGIPYSKGTLHALISYDCGQHGMQLVVKPWRTPHVFFKAFDEFGNLFEVKDCSECHHFLSWPDNATFVFSAGYHGCHVLQKGQTFHLNILVELINVSQEVTYAKKVSMVCPKPDSVSEAFATSPPTMLQKPTQSFTDLFVSTKPVLSSSTNLQMTTLSSTVPLKTANLSSSLPFTILQKTMKPFKPALIPGIYSPEKRCQVGSGKIICGQTGISKESCLHAGCCYNASDSAMPCYYSNSATAQCTSDGYFIVVISRDMLDNPVVLDKVHFPDTSPACHPLVKTDTFLLFRFSLRQCGTTFKLTGDRLMYETTLSSSIHVQKGRAGSITRDATFALVVRCSYSARDFLPLQVEVFTPPPLPAVTGAGPLHLEMRIARDAQYSSYYTEAEYPVSKVLRDPVYIEVRLLHRADPRLVLVLHQCWAAPTSNPMWGSQWPILVDKCPFSGDNYRTLPVLVGSALPLHSHYQRFSVATFAFLDSSPQKALAGQVYFFCSASACHPTRVDSCVPRCQTRRRRFLYLQHQALNDSLDLVSSYGPVSFLESESLPDKTQDQHEPLNTSPTSWILLWTLVTFFMAVAILAVAALWYTYRRSHCRPL